MNIAILTNDATWTYNLRKELIEELLKNEHQINLLLPYGDKAELLKDLGCVFYTINYKKNGTNPFEDIKLFFTYLTKLKKIKPDIVLSYTIKPNIYGGLSCELLNIPYVANITGLGPAVEKPGILQKLTVFLYKLAFYKVKKIFFQNSENMQFFIDRNIAVDKHDLLPGSGVNLKKFSYIDYPGNAKIEFAFISRIMKEKGVDQYLEAAQNLKQKYPQTVFHVCGFCEEAYEDKLEDLHNRGIVVYHGMVSDVREVLKDVCCVVHPTYYPEGLSNVLLEASACGRPIITTNRSGCREVIDDGINGYIVNQQDGKDLTEKIEKFIQLSYDEKKEMGINGRKKVEKSFDRQIVVDAYLKELQ